MHRRRISILLSAFATAIAFGGVSPIALAEKKPKAKVQKPKAEKEQQQETAADDALMKKVNLAVKITEGRYLTAGVHTPWQIMHGLLAMRGEYLLKEKSGTKINATRWIAKGQTFGGEPWFQKTRYGAQAHKYTSDYIFEGHPNQFLAIMASAGFPKDFKIKADNGTVTVLDIVNNSKKETNSEEELTWTLWAMSHYLGPDATWTNRFGEAWSIERLVSIQNRQDVTQAACGGTHSLFALAYARKEYLKTKRPLRGVWLEADQRIKKYIEMAKAYQNEDGSFPPTYFKARGYSREFEKRLSATGHILEFLMLALPDKRLNEDWVRKAVQSVADELIDNKTKPAEPGALYHALDGLILYRSRITGKGPIPAGEAKEYKEPTTANKPAKKVAKSKLPLPTLPTPPKP